MDFDEFKTFWISFVSASEEFYHIRDIEHSLGDLKTIIMDAIPKYKDADFLLGNKDAVYGMLLGILFALDCFPTPEYVSLEKLTKVRTFCQEMIRLFKPYMMASLSKGA
jgi:hypothetical protein